MSTKYIFDNNQKVFGKVIDTILPSYEFGIVEVTEQTYNTYFNVGQLIDYIDNNNVTFFNLPYSIEPYTIKLDNFNKPVTYQGEIDYYSVYNVDILGGEVLKFNAILKEGDKYTVNLVNGIYELQKVSDGDIIPFDNNTYILVYGRTTQVNREVRRYYNEIKIEMPPTYYEVRMALRIRKNLKTLTTKWFRFLK